MATFIKYMPSTSKSAYIISHIDTFGVVGKVAMTYGVNHVYNIHYFILATVIVSLLESIINPQIAS
jgi:hypothetical protein